MKTARIMVAGIAVGLTSFILTGCQPSEEKKAAQPAATLDTATPAAKALPASDKPKDHPAH